MKHMKKFLLIVFLVAAFVAPAQTITIGEGTGQTTQVPFNTFANYSFTEQLLLPCEIEFAGYIKAIKFRIAYSYNTEATTDLNVYLKNTSRSSFSDPSEFEPVSSENLVFSGVWTIPANTDDWMTITFDTPFYYNGTDNLLIAIDENSANYDIRYFRYVDVDDLTLSYSDDYVNPDPLDLGSFTGLKEVVDQRANIKLVFGPNDGVNESTKTTLTVYPSPASDVLNLEGIHDEMVSVYDVTGRLVMQAFYKDQLPIERLESGVYMVSTSLGMLKFIKK